jgi:hypothetical protein
MPPRESLGTKRISTCGDLQGVPTEKGPELHKAQESAANKKAGQGGAEGRPRRLPFSKMSPTTTRLSRGHMLCTSLIRCTSVLGGTGAIRSSIEHPDCCGRTACQLDSNILRKRPLESLVFHKLSHFLKTPILVCLPFVLISSTKKLYPRILISILCIGGGSAEET